MKLKDILYLSIALILTSCVNNTQPKKTVKAKDTLTYTLKVIKERAADCGANPDSTCTLAIYTYPVFKGQPALNDSVKHVLVNFFNSDQNPDTSLKQSAQLFLKSYGNYKRSYPKSTVPFKLRSSTNILGQDSSLTTLKAGIFVFMGAGNGGFIDKYINWDTGTGKKLSLDDLFTDGYQDKLTSIAEGIFRRQEKLRETEPLTKYLFPNHQFKLNDNFLITPEGISFLYNQNEIKPHDAGATELLLPYKDIQSLLKPNTVLSQFIKQ